MSHSRDGCATDPRGSPPEAAARDRGLPPLRRRRLRGGRGARVRKGAVRRTRARDARGSAWGVRPNTRWGARAVRVRVRQRALSAPRGSMMTRE
eukprot:6723009-Prymnesium_polylepis.2